jgi:diacylglycerol O-acyltransferase / wax synthase
MMDRSLRRHFEMHTVPLDHAQRVARARGATLNDLYVAGIAGGLGQYHVRMGAPSDALRMAMPVNLRGHDDVGGNHFAPTRLVVPTQPKDAATRLAGVRDVLHGLRSEAALGAADALAGAAARLPTSVVVNFTRAQARTIDFATSNLRGSPVPLYLAGARITASYPMGPRVGAAINATLMSYCGEMHIGFNIDPAAVTDRSSFMECVAESFDDLLALA